MKYTSASLNNGFPPTGEPHFTMHVGEDQHSSIIGVRYGDTVYCFYSEGGYNEPVDEEWSYVDPSGSDELGYFQYRVMKFCLDNGIPLR